MAEAYCRRRTELLNAPLFGIVPWETMIAEFDAALEHRSHATQVQYARTLEHLATFLGGAPNADDLRPERLQAWINARAREAGAATVHKDYRHLRRFVRFGLGRDWWRGDPTRGLTLPQRTRRLVRAPDVAAVRTLLERVGRTRDPLGWYLAVRIGFETGLRQGDVVALDWPDLKRETIDERERTAIVAVAGKTLKESAFVLTHGLERAIDAARDEGRRPVLGWNRWRRESWDALRTAAGLEQVTFHGLRAAAATETAVLGASLGAAAILLDHAAKRTTLNHYVDRLRFAAARADLLERCGLPEWKSKGTG